MKKIIALIYIFNSVFCIFKMNAQAPHSIPYQAAARDSIGSLISNQSISLRFSIRNGIAAGIIVYQETQIKTTNSLGLFTANIGEGNLVSGLFSSIDWENGAKFIQVELDATGGINYVDMGTTQMLSVPYALSAGNGLPQGTFVGQMNYWDGTEWKLVQTGQNNQNLTYCNGVPTWGTCPEVLPVVITSSISSIITYNATSGGDVTYDGNTPITARGICWSTNTNPTTALSTKTNNGTGSGSFVSLLTGLSLNTVYYVRAYATNIIGTSYGNEVVFTSSSMAPPTATTNNASSLTGTTAAINGSGNPNGLASTAWFRYAAVSPGTSNDVFGTRVPASGGTALGSGLTSVAFSEVISGLIPGTTYYYCAIVENTLGTSFGALASFTTPLPPIAATNIATIVASTSAALNGTGNPMGGSTTSWFRYSTTNPGTGNDVFGTRSPASGGTVLGSGFSPAAFSQSISGLLPEMTYYYCAIAQNSEGISFGTIQSFTTLGIPTALTNAASSITSSSAVLNGAGNPKGVAATGWYRYSTINPVTGNDNFGTRAPSSGGSSLGSGNASTAYTQTISGLIPGTTYYYCAIVSNTEGTVFGSVLSFTTLTAAPTVTTSGATSLTGTTAALNGNANPNGAASTGWFRYSTVSPGTGNDVFGIRAPASGGTALGSGTSSTAFSQGVTGLIPGTTYYYCAIAQNTLGTSFGTIVSFTTSLAPIAATNSASSVSSTTASLNGTGTPRGASTTSWFRYSTTNPGTGNDVFGTRSPASGGTALGSGFSSVAYSQGITGLTPGTTYYFCSIAQNSEGTSFGAIQSFTTLAAPIAATNTATLVTSFGATLNGTGDPNGAAATGWYRYSTINPGTGDDNFGTRAPSSGGSSLGSGTASVAYTRVITGLLPGTTYYYCAIVSNSEGTVFGAVLSFTTLAGVPTVTTNSVTSLTGTTAVLNGNANPNGAASTGWFRYSTVSPGTGNDSFGTRAPASGGSALGSGTSSAAFSQGVTGLIPGTTYYFCAIVQNSMGTSFGAVLSFTTP